MAVLEGDLSYIILKELLYFLSRFRKTGKLVVKKKGNIYISDGKVIHADTDSKEGIDAFFSLSLLRNGTFSFYADEKSSINTISKPLSELFDMIETREAELEEFKKDLPPYTTVPEKSSKAPDDDKVELKKDDWKVLILANGDRTLEDIIEASPLDKLDTFKSLSWLFKQGLLYDPEEKRRVVEENTKKINKFLEVFGEGPWQKKIDEHIEEWELEDVVSINNHKLGFNDEDSEIDLDRTKNFFNDLFSNMEEVAVNTLGKLLVRKKMNMVNQSDES